MTYPSIRPSTPGLVTGLFSQTDPTLFKPSETIVASTSANLNRIEDDHPLEATTNSRTESRHFAPPRPAPAVDQHAGVDAAVIQQWEGRVLSADHEKGFMQVLLFAKLGQVADHSAEISLSWVADQDMDLVIPGAVFYLTLYRQLRRGSVKNSEELRFRRRPAWSKWQIQRIEENAKMLRSKMKSKPMAE
ncbi:MAG TPA: hypothetical protein VFW68_13780 [Rhodocyclaceae bacterium]|nr:hypothetical protein [Rhodocyclaceae bacterium]